MGRSLPWLQASLYKQWLQNRRGSPGLLCLTAACVEEPCYLRVLIKDAGLYPLVNLGRNL